VKKHQHTPGEQLMPREGRFLEALGIDPGLAVAETVRLKWMGGNIPVVSYLSVHQFAEEEVAAALMLAAQQYEADKEATAQWRSEGFAKAMEDT
jgi:hypothetical protein